MLGLKKGTVKLVAHNPKWKQLFEKERKSLEKNMGVLALSVEHVGSTSIPNIVAKPILDIDVGVKSIKDFKKVTAIIEKLGYGKVKNKSAPQVHLVFAKGSKKLGTIHYLHLIKHNGTIWNHDIHFRDYLRTHKKVALQYSQLKKKLAKKYPNDRIAYTKGKENFIEKVAVR